MEAVHAVVVVKEARLRQFLVDALAREGVEVSVASSGQEGLELLERQRAQVLFADLDIADISDEFVRGAVSIQPRLSVVGLGSPAAREAAVRWSQIARMECLCKPLTAEAIRSSLAGGVRRYMGAKQAQQSSEGPALQGATARSADQAGERIVAASAAMREVMDLVAKVAPSDAAVLIEGESGTGKRLLAQEIHCRSRRSRAAFVRVACGALRECEIQSRLFGQPGYDWGEADSRRPSFWESCSGGTLFLDDLTQLPLWTQVKLLDVLQDGLPSAGGGEPAPPDVRVIASLSQDVEGALAHNVLCPELYYYLNVVHIYLPPLRHRQQGIRALAEHFLALAAARCGVSPGARTACRFSPEAWQCLLNFDWPGNAKQLASVVAHAVVLSDGAEIGKACVAEALSEAHCQPVHSDAISVPLVGGLKRMERSIIDEVIQRCRGNKAAAARALGLHRRTLYRLLEEDHSSKDDQTILSLTPDVAAS